jgi:hypothetical protein
MSAVSGVTQLESLYRELSKGVANRIARPALSKAGRLSVKKIKADIPSRYKSVRRAIKWRSVKTRYNKGIAGVKVGAGVGKGSGIEVESRSKRRGVGISARNIHWWFLGTGFRRTKRGQYTGIMPRQHRSVSSIVNGAAVELAAVIQVAIASGIEKETTRMARKRGR